MKKIILHAVGCSFLISGITGCKPENNCIAGGGGNFTVVGFFNRDGREVVNHEWHLDTVWVKYNALQAPDKYSPRYDTMIVGEEGEDHIHIKGLKCGDYFFYAAGLDTTLDTIMYPHVTGSFAFTVEGTAGEAEIIIPVSQ
jgi:hypothetical protein